ncbi:molecular chaperone HscC [uncultured Sphingomonas sp.]|uniref:Hsp70 family protein n=1 Tax=uncultured Sphingomonas sp. TaxID=158754 RepID=UPI0025E54AB0|nr:molecular chaperone HscC [uncultured Sphingomonas sp.]
MILGIDLGTTNSAAAVWRDNEAVLIPNALGEGLTPSAVSIGDDGAVLVGSAARDRQATHPDRTATSFKRLMGTREVIRLAGQAFSPEDLSALVLRALKADAEAFFGEEIDQAIITVPAYFNDRQRKATRRAGELAGLSVPRLLNEPTAAALAFGMKDRADREPFLIFDLGGGTFDVSIVEMFDAIVEVRASTGDNRLGGDDFNEVIAALAVPRLLKEGLLARVPAQRASKLLAAAAEKARRTLTTQPQAEFDIAYDGRQASVVITAAEFETACQPLIERLRQPVLRALRDSDIRVETLSEVVLAGGATRMPVVRRAITRMFGRFPAGTVHPDHAIALGAGIQAGLVSRDAGLDEVRLTDICPYSLGVDHAVRTARGDLRGGLFSPIINRNTPVPVSRVERYVTLGDQQREVAFGIYQGEAREVSGNVKLGEIKVPVPPRPAGEIHVECRFSYDSSGLLEVDVTVPATGMTRNLLIMDEDAPEPQDLTKRREALAQLKVHPRDDAANAATKARAERCYEECVGDLRDQIGQWIITFESVLDSQDPRAIEESRVALEQALDSVEGQRFL